MILTRNAALALAAMFCAALAHADPPARTGRLNYVHGTVSLAPAEAPDAWAVAIVNRPLTTGDRLWTDRDGYAEFHVGSTAARLAPHTNVDVLTLDDDTLQLRLAQGDLNVRVREVTDDTIEIDTPNGAVLLEQPGSYRISAAADAAITNVIVHSGQARVLATHGDVSVREGEHVTLRGSEGFPSEMVRAGLDEFDRWCAELDRREDDVIATRYLSSNMTGYEDLDAHGTWRTTSEYGAVWMPSVAAGWAPYRYGHWIWMEPWGWTWVDDAPWGFAPFHYGRWVYLNGYWAWAPGPRIARPVYAPALVAFVGGASWSVAVRSGPAVGWFPIGWREPYFPWYRTSAQYVRHVNGAHVRNINVYNNVTRVTYVNQSAPHAVTVVPREAFVSARPVARSALDLPRTQLSRAPLIKSLPAEPVAGSFAARRADARPPEAAIRREVIAVRPPRAQVARPDSNAASRRERDGERAASPVRVIERPHGDAGRAARPGGERPRPSAAPGAAARTESRKPEIEQRPRNGDRPRSVPVPRIERREEKGAGDARSRESPPTPAQRPADAERGRRTSPERPATQPRVQPERRPSAAHDPRPGNSEPSARREAQPRAGSREAREPTRERHSPQREPGASAPAPGATSRADARPERRALPSAPARPETRAGGARSEPRGAPRAQSPRSNAGENRNRRDAQQQ